MLHSNVNVNSIGHLTFAGCDVVSLAEKHGTPLMLLDVDRVKSNLRIYRDEMKKHFGENSYPCYASKALSITEIYRICNGENVGIDVVSPGEIYTAKRANFPLNKAFFHGNNKTDWDIEYAIKSGVGYFVVDNIEELKKISEVAVLNGINQKILLRLSPGIDPHTHAKITTGQVDSKFGTAIETGQAFEMVESALKLSGIDLKGFHCHVGSQCFDSSAFIDAAKIMLTFIRDVKTLFKFETEILNLGGGYGVRYVESDPVINIPANIKLVADVVKQTSKELNLNIPNVIFEPGRSIVADAGITLYTVGSFKTIDGYKSYASIDGGMPDNPRYALYGSKYTVINASKADVKPNVTATIAGRCCESGDLIQEDVEIAKPKRGDVIAVLVTGAYNYSMASNYNRIPRPPIVAIEKGTEKVIVKRESFEDLVKNEI